MSVNEENNQTFVSQDDNTVLNNSEIPQLANDFVDKIFNKYEQSDFNPLPGFLNRQEVRKKVTLSEIGDHGCSIEEAAAEEIEALEQDANLRHPRFYGFIPGPAQSVSWLGDIIATAYNSHAGGWYSGPGASSMEKAVIEWALGRLGWDHLPYAGGILESGGTMAGFTALAAARDAKVNVSDLSKAVVYLTDQTHTANHKALHLIGIPRSNWRFIPTEDYKMVAEELRRQVKADMDAGLTPVAVIGTCGTTNTGSIDPLDAIADVCQAYDIWFHVDGAYGGSVILSDRRDSAVGIERADSLAWDGHKWLYQIYGIAFCLVRDKRHLMRTYSVGGEYLQDVEGKGMDPDWWDLGPELTRPARAPRLWLTLKTVGNKELSRMINASIQLAEWFEDQVRQSDRLEVVSPASLAIITFRVKADSDQESERKNLALAEKLRKHNIAGIFTTELDGRNVLRICTISPEETLEDFQDMYQAINRVMDELGF